MIDTDIRQILDEVADQGRPVNLAAPAWRQAKRMRTRRHAAAGMAVVATVLVVGVLAVVASGGHSTHGTAQPATSRSGSIAPTDPPTAPAGTVNDPPVPLPGGWIIAGGPGTQGTWIYNRVTGAYQRLPYDSAIPAPIGDLVFVGSGQAGWVLDVRTGHRVPVDQTGDGLPKWNADGTKLLNQRWDRAARVTRVYVTDAATGSAHEVPIAHGCPGECDPTWMPDGTQIAVQSNEEPDTGATIVSVATGTIVRRVPWAAHSSNGFSPDGRFVVASEVLGGLDTTGIFDVSTNQMVHNIDVADARVVYWASADRLLIVRERGVEIATTADTGTGFVWWPREFGSTELPNYTLAKG